MSRVLSTQQSLEAPSRYTFFERDVYGASSPQSPRRPGTSSRKLDKSKKKRFSEVAFAGESPNLQDVSSGILSKSKKSVLVVSDENRSVEPVQPSTSRHVFGVSSPVSNGILSKSKKSVLVVSDENRSVDPVQPSTSRYVYGVSSPVLFESHSGSSTPSLCGENGNVPHVQPAEKVPHRATTTPLQATQDPRVDFLVTESLIESSAVIDGQPNVLRIDSSPDVLPKTSRLSRNQQVELSIKKAREWLNSIPDNSDPVSDVETHNNSLLSSISRRSNTPADRIQESVLVVAPDPTVREVRILLQRLDPQVLLRVPIRDIENMMNAPSDRSLTGIQKTMNILLSSNKIGLTPVDKRLTKSIQPSSVLNNTHNVSSRNVRNRSMEKKSKGKRRLFTVQRRLSNVSLDLSVSTENVNVQCPYTPPTKKKRGRPPLQKPSAPVQKKLLPELGLPNTKGLKNKLPKQRNPPKKKSPVVTQPTVVTRTRSSEVLKAQMTPEAVKSKAVPEKDLETVSSTGNVRKKSHEMNLRKKTTPRRTSLFIQPKSQVSKPKKALKRNSTSSRKSTSSKQGPKVVCTFLHRDEVDRVAIAIKKLGGMMESKVSALTTHVVCGGPRRTVNMLRGIARGCWLVTFEWVLQSMEKQKWIEEEQFEVTNFSPAVKQCRIEKLSLGRTYPTFFKNVGTIYVAPKTAPPKSELTELLKLCGANVVTTTRRASVAVGAKVPGATSVNEVWVLDSIQENKLLPLQPYLLDD